LEFEPEIADAREEAVELGLVCDLADELGTTGVAHERHSFEGSREASAQPAAHDDPGPGRSHTVSPPSALRASRAECPQGLGDSASPSSRFTQGDRLRRLRRG
jgi:hypothetical protein